MTTIALIGGCCGNGVARALAGIGEVGYFYHPDDNNPLPCYCSGGVFNPIQWNPGEVVQFSSQTGHIMGYDSDRDWLVYSPTSHFEMGFGSGFTPTAPDEIGGVSYRDFRQCSFEIGTEPFELISDTDGNTIGAATAPGGGPYLYLRSVWSCVSKTSDDEWRLYGWTAWFPLDGTPDEDERFKAWSVLYDGSDYQEHFILEGTRVLTMSVMAGDIVTCEQLGTSTDGKIRVNGGGGTTQYGVTSATTGATIGGSIVGMGTGQIDSQGTFVDNSETGGIYLAFTADGNDYVLGGASMGWNHKLNALVILWANWGTVALPTGWPTAYVSLHTTAPSAGNIVGQDGVTITGVQWRGFDHANGNSPIQWHVPITYCAMSRHIDLTVYTPPDPPNPKPNCDQYNECDDLDRPFSGSIDGFEDCSLTNADYTRSNLNGGITLEPATTFAVEVLYCTSADKGHFYTPLVDYWTSSDWATRYATPGTPWEQLENPGIDRDEVYIAGIAVEVACEDGLVYIARCSLLRQRFNFVWDGGDYVPNTGFIQLTCEDYTTIAYKSGTPMNGMTCSTGPFGMSTTFEYDKCGTTKLFTVNGEIGPVGAP